MALSRCTSTPYVLYGVDKYPAIDILPMARRQGSPTLASGIFLLPWRLACTVPLVVALTFTSTDVSSRKPCGTCETVFQAPTYYRSILLAVGKSRNPPTQAPNKDSLLSPVWTARGLTLGMIKF